MLALASLLIAAASLVSSATDTPIAPLSEMAIEAMFEPSSPLSPAVMSAAVSLTASS